MYQPSRRHFLKISARSLAALGGASIAGRLGRVSALAASTCPSEYKALVCVFLFGGNDGNNTVIPVSISSQTNPVNSYANYAKVRGGLALPQANLGLINTGQGDAYGLHPSMTELTSLYNNNKNVAVVANVGTLVNPLTQAQYKNQSASVPQNLFSHLDQQIEWQTSAAQGFATTGWGGRLADAMQDCNPNQLPIAISLGGNVLFATGGQTNPATISAGQVLGLQGFANNAASTARLTALQNLLRFDNGLALVQAANTIATAGISQSSILNKALTGAPALSTVFPNTSLGQQMAQIAKIINVRATLGVNRQIFFASLGGFDTHDLELNDQASGLQQVSQALSAFYNASVEMGVSRDVVTFTESDFGRTFQPSGGSTLGTDHAWGSHHFIVGDAVKGGDIYGTFPTHELNGPDDATGRGVWIPTTALEQYGATLATWFGVDPTKLDDVFPNLKNFPGALPAFL